MPKTRNAFAFKDFDETRIISRKFFDRFNVFFEVKTEHISENTTVTSFVRLFKNKTDHEVFERLIKDDYEIFSELKSAGGAFMVFEHGILKTTRQIISAIDFYFQRIHEHTLRITKIDTALLRQSAKLNAEILEKDFVSDVTKSKGLLITQKRKRIDELINAYSKILQSLNKLKKFLFEKVEFFNAELEKRFRKNFAYNLKEARKNKKLTQQGLAILTGLNRSDIVLFERGVKIPSLFNFYKLVIGGNISADELLIGE